MIVCHCQRVSDRQVERCIRGGCASVQELCQETGAGFSCGSCIGSLKQLLARHLVVDEREMVTHAASQSAHS